MRFCVFHNQQILKRIQNTPVFNDYFNDNDFIFLLITVYPSFQQYELEEQDNLVTECLHQVLHLHTEINLQVNTSYI